MDIRSVSTVSQGPQGLDALGATAAPPPQTAQSQPPAKNLEPAVKLDIGSETYQPRIIQDTDTKSIVFQVVDSSGTVVDQLPSESALRNRAYASANANLPDTRSGSSAVSRVA